MIGGVNVSFLNYVSADNPFMDGREVEVFQVRRWQIRRQKILSIVQESEVAFKIAKVSVSEVITAEANTSDLIISFVSDG